MSANGYADLSAHIGHDIVCVGYGLLGEEPVNVALECETCSVVLLDFDHPDAEEMTREDTPDLNADFPLE